MSESRRKNINILLICREGRSREEYQEQLSAPGVSLVCVQAPMSFYRHKVYRPLNGIMVDMPTYMRCSEEEKRLLTEMVGLFPALRLKCHEVSGEIRMLPFGKVYPVTATAADFIQSHCSSFEQRKVRTCERVQHNLSAILSTSLPVESRAGVRSVTANISRRGCFLVNFQPWLIGEFGWLVFPDLKDTTPIQIRVCTSIQWGESRSLPGIGVEFVELTDSQRDEITLLGGQDLMQEDV
ncbi:MAG: hypothetical protein A2X80_13270 [Geobacteraceae bacterium GWB2_52_12]|nr:MAG: hypothetical protein A2X80_13270 [Geobacteraceae bacterium GWB2_52_12]